MSRLPKKVHIVSHTHWDREWYQTFHEFRVDLERVMGQLLQRLETDESFHHFVLDGQTLLLEDYLALHPEDGPRIRALVDRGALSIGPWYVLPDEFLVSGEAMARNLLLGRHTARPLGGAQAVGYLPDSFGHFAQLPQVLERAGIGTFVYTRGNGDELERLGHEYRWEAPDGSTVLAIQQCRGYCNGGGLGYDELWHAHTQRNVRPERAVEQVHDLFEEMARLSRGDVYLLNNGCDHFPPQPCFAAILARLRAAFPTVEFVHGSLAAYLDEVEASGVATERYQGDLLGGKYHPILSGVWSARMYLKQANDRCQNLLSRQLEPLLCYAHFMHGHRYPAATARSAWKLLLQNHPHDSICGCSTDAVHREMMPRFAGVAEGAEQLMRRSMRDLVPLFGRGEAGDRETVVSVFNPLPRPRDEVIERLVVLQPHGYDFNRLALFDESGHPVPCEIESPRFAERFWGIDYRTQLRGEDQRARYETYRAGFPRRMNRPAAVADRSDAFVWLRFLARDLPPVGHRRYFLREAGGEAPIAENGRRTGAPGLVRVSAPEGTPPPEQGREPSAGVILENRRCRVCLYADGTLDLTEKDTGRTYAGLGLLLDRGDAGDEYDFSPAGDDMVGTEASHKGTVRVVEGGGLIGSAEATYTLSLPRELQPDRTLRAPERVDCPVTVRVTLRGEDPRVDLDVEFENRAKDHRVQICFPTPVVTERVVTDAHFYLHERPLVPQGARDWVQPHPGTLPQQEFASLRDDGGGLAVMTRGLPEIEGYRTAAGADGRECANGADRGDGTEGTNGAKGADGAAGLRVTLLRAVGWLSRDDFPSRNHANAGPTVETPEAQCLGRHRYQLALRAFGPAETLAQIKQDSLRWRAEVVTTQGVAEGSAPGDRSLLRHQDARVAVSAIKRHEERDTLIVRLYNLTHRAVSDRLEVGAVLASAWRADLLERRGEPLELEGERVLPVTLGPHEITTVELAFRRRSRAGEDSADRSGGPDGGRR